MEIEFANLTKILNTPPAQGYEGIVRQVTTDSRQVGDAPTTLFVALKGPMRDGHAFISDAYSKGIRQFLVEEATHLPSAGVYRVPSTMVALQQIATNQRRTFDYPVLAITGSNGKTIVKEWLATIVGHSFEVVKSPKSYNSQIGVPLSVMEMNGHHTLGIFEAGISKMGEMEKLEKILRPDIGIFTNIGPAHAEGFDSIEIKAKAKALLFRNAQSVICRHEHTIVQSAIAELHGPTLITWSTKSPEATVWFELLGRQARLHFQQREETLSLPFEDDPMLENLFHAITAALMLGVPLNVIAERMKALPSLDSRLSLKRGRDGCYLIDDSYNNDLIGLKAALETQDAQKTDNLKKTVILSDMLESGLDKEKLYEEIQHLLKVHHISRFMGIGFEEDKWPPSDFECAIFPTTEDFLISGHTFKDELILIKGARVFGLERVVEQLRLQRHRTQLTISFEKLRHNLTQFKQLLAPSTQIMAMVKAFAYGGGAYEIASFLQYQGVDYLGVAYVDEGRLLREQGINIPIMVMNPTVESLSDCSKYALEPVVYNLPLLQEIRRQAEPPPFHLEMETGMHRLGFEKAELAALIASLSTLDATLVKSVFTHLAASDEAEKVDFTKKQLQAFDEMYSAIAAAIGHTPLKHALNTAGIITQNEHQYDMVRLGIGLYGIDPTGSLALESVSAFSTFISQIKTVKKGDSVGYGRSGIVSRDSRIATIPVGYADGYLRIFGNGRAKVLVGTDLVPTVGNVCMDMTMIDVTDCPSAAEGQEVTLMGEQPHISDLAQWAGTIPYEILTGISHRVERIYSWL